MHWVKGDVSTLVPNCVLISFQHYRMLFTYHRYITIYISQYSYSSDYCFIINAIISFFFSKDKLRIKSASSLDVFLHCSENVRVKRNRELCLSKKKRFTILRYVG